MPLAPKRPCRQPGCPALVDSGYCEKHQVNNPDKQRWRDMDRTRGNLAARGYDGHHRKFRAWCLSRRPICEASEGCTRPATDIHHLHPVSDTAWYQANPGAMRDPENVQCLCHRHHQSKGGRGGRV